MTRKRKRGAPKGNQNARKHGLYSRIHDKRLKLRLDQALTVEGIDEEIAVMRLKLRTLLKEYPDRIDMQVIVATTIARLVRTKFKISKDQKKPLKDAITKALTEIAVPLGIKALIQ